MPDETDGDHQPPAVDDARSRWRELPPRVDPEDWVAEVPAEAPNPPEIGDPDRDFMLRYS